MRNPRNSRSGYVLADTLAGLAILAAGLAAFLGCMSQSHKLMARARDLKEVRAEAGWRLSRTALSVPGQSSVVVMRPHPGPVQLARAGAALCDLQISTPSGRRPAIPMRTVRFCLPSGGSTS